MQLLLPSSLLSFRCTAGACRHTCCVGWEIDIDEESMEKYRDFPEILSRIEPTDTPHFRLEEGERCPFLNGQGLCDLILRHGEDILCQICRDHPRFRNYWTGRIEMGMGLVCEEAARLILGSPVPLRLAFIRDSFRELTDGWNGAAEELAERCRVWSYDVEYDEEELERRISSHSQEAPALPGSGTERQSPDPREP